MKLTELGWWCLRNSASLAEWFSASEAGAYPATARHLVDEGCWHYRIGHGCDWDGGGVEFRLSDAGRAALAQAEER